MELRIPKLREGSYFPSLLEPRRRSEKALLADTAQYVEGVSTRRVDDLVKALGCEGISKSRASAELDRVVDSFLDRPLTEERTALWLDALSQKVREEGRIVNVSVAVASRIIGMDVGTSEDGAFWLAFLRSLSARGLSGVDLVISDAHRGLRDAIASVRRCELEMSHALHDEPAARVPLPWWSSAEEVHSQLERVIARSAWLDTPTDHCDDRAYGLRSTSTDSPTELVS